MPDFFERTLDLPREELSHDVEKDPSHAQAVSFKHDIPVRSVVDRQNHVLFLVSEASQVLHVGCSDHPLTESLLSGTGLLHSRILEVNPQTIGFDLSRTGLSLLETRYPNASFMHGNAEQLDTFFPPERFDLIVAGEILEHLSNPGSFLDSCATVLSESGTLLLTVPNAFGFRRLIHNFLGVENYHPDHAFYFSENTIRTLVSRHGFTIHQAFYYATPDQGSLLKRILYFFVETMPAKIFGNHFMEGLVIELRRIP